MISDNYLDETAEMLTTLGYAEAFMEDLTGGEAIAIMEKDYKGDGDTRDVVSYLSVLPDSVRKDRWHNSDDTSGLESGCTIRFIARTDRGATKPMSYASTWGIYILQEQPETIEDDEWVDKYDWYSLLPRWSRWWKFGWAAEGRRNLRLSLKRNSLYELRHYRRLAYKLRRKGDN